MNKLFKGAVAGAAGLALLLGGAGTFALWNDASSIGTDQSITSGQLQFGAVPAGSWTLNTHKVDDIGEVRIVPGDTLVYTADVPVVAEGNYLDATFGVDYAGMTGETDLLAALMSNVQVVVTDPDDGVWTDQDVPVTPSDDGEAQIFNVKVTIPFDADGLTAQNQTVNLSNVNLTLQQS